MNYACFPLWQQNMMKQAAGTRRIHFTGFGQKKHSLARLWPLEKCDIVMLALGL